MGEALTVCSHEQSTKELSRKEWGGCDQSGCETGWLWLFSLCVGQWGSWAALLDARLHASVFGKDGAVWEVMEGSHGAASPGKRLLWRWIYILELLRCFSSALNFGVWAASQVVGASQSMGWWPLCRVFALTTAELHLRRAKAHGVCP